MLKNHLNTDYRNICSTSVPVNDTLFGGDIEKTIDSVTKANRVGNKVGSRAYTYNNSYKNRQTYNRGRGNYGYSRRGAYDSSNKYRGRGRGQYSNYNAKSSHGKAQASSSQLQ